MKFRNKIYPAFLFPFSIFTLLVQMTDKPLHKKLPFLGYIQTAGADQPAHQSLAKHGYTMFFAVSSESLSGLCRI